MIDQGAATRLKQPQLKSNYLVYLEDVTAEIADTLGFARPEGALVEKLHPESPLAAAGMKTGDVILGFDGKPVENAKEFDL